MTRPTETITAIVGSILGALGILGEDVLGLTLSQRTMGALTLLVGWVATVVTAVVANRQRKGQLPSADDGAVHDA